MESNSCLSNARLDMRARLCHLGDRRMVHHAILLYRQSCPRCRFLSRIVVVLSGRGVRRVPNDTPEAAELYERLGETVGKLALLHRGRLHTGRRVFAVAALAIADGWLARIPLVGRLVA
jgi:hypothetical protein